jgi:hypothetical protein
MKITLIILFLFYTSLVFAGSVPIKDNLLFGFEKCKSLSVDLEKGQLKENVSSSFDVHCKKNKNNGLAFNCDFFETGSDKKFLTKEFTGGSDLGIAELKTNSGEVIEFLIGKKYSSFKSNKDLRACVGIFLFESEAIKKRSESLN